MYPIISLFCKSHLTTILNFNLSRLPSYLIFPLWTSIHDVTGYPLSGSSIRKVWFLVKYLIYFKVAYNQDFLTSADNLATSAQLLSSGMKSDTSEPDSTKLVNGSFNSFKKSLNNLCKPSPILFVDRYAPFYSLCAYLIR